MFSIIHTSSKFYACEFCGYMVVTCKQARDTDHLGHMTLLLACLVVTWLPHQSVHSTKSPSRASLSACLSASLTAGLSSRF